MWANTIWGFWTLAASCLLAMLGLDQSWRPMLLGLAIVFFVIGLVVLLWPYATKLLVRPLTGERERALQRLYAQGVHEWGLSQSHTNDFNYVTAHQKIVDWMNNVSPLLEKLGVPLLLRARFQTLDDFTPPQDERQAITAYWRAHLDRLLAAMDGIGIEP